MRSALGAMVVVGLGAVACGDSGGSGGGGSSGSDKTSSSSAPALLDQSDACKKFVECTSAVAPSGLGPVLDAYGPEGSCWGENEDLWNTCNDACINGTIDWAASFPDEPACWACDENADCAEPTPACDLVSHTCVPANAVTCMTNDHCPTEAPICYTDVGEPGCLPTAAACVMWGMGVSTPDLSCLTTPACYAVWGPGGPCSGCTGTGFQDCMCPVECDDYLIANQWPLECIQC